MYSALLKLIRPLLTSKCKMRELLLRFCTQLVPRMFLLEKFLPLLLMMLMILLLSRTTFKKKDQHQHKLLQLLQNLLLNLLQLQLNRLLLQASQPLLHHKVVLEHLQAHLPREVQLSMDLTWVKSQDQDQVEESLMPTSTMLLLPAVPKQVLHFLTLQFLKLHQVALSISPTLKSEK